MCQDMDAKRGETFPSNDVNLNHETLPSLKLTAKAHENPYLSWFSYHQNCRFSSQRTFSLPEIFLRLKPGHVTLDLVIDPDET